MVETFSTCQPKFFRVLLKKTGRISSLITGLFTAPRSEELLNLNALGINEDNSENGQKESTAKRSHLIKKGHNDYSLWPFISTIKIYYEFASISR